MIVGACFLFSCDSVVFSNVENPSVFLIMTVGVVSRFSCVALCVAFCCV